MSQYLPHSLFPPCAKPSQVLVWTYVFRPRILFTSAMTLVHGISHKKSSGPMVNLVLQGAQSSGVYLVLARRPEYLLRNNLGWDASPVGTLAPFRYQFASYATGWMKTGELASTPCWTLGIPAFGMHNGTPSEDTEYIELCFLYFLNISFRSFGLK